jgi:hypothetical protein
VWPLALRTVSLCCDKLNIQDARQPRCDLVLHVEEIGTGLVEPLGLEMRPRLGVDELCVDANAVAPLCTLPPLT